MPRILLISSNEKARRISDRTLPSEEELKASCGRALIVSRFEHRNDIVTANRPAKHFDDGATLLGHRFEGVGPADRVLDVAHALIRKVNEQNVGLHLDAPRGSWLESE